MDKSEFPSKQRIQELREEGHVSFSVASQFGCASLVTTLYCVFGSDSLKSISSRVQKLLAHSALSDITQKGGQLLTEVYQYVFTFLLLIIISQLSWGLIQTRFFLKFNELTFNLSNITDGITFQTREILVRILFLLTTLFIFIVVFIVSFYSGISIFLPFYNSSFDYFLGQIIDLRVLAFSLWISLSLFLMLGGVVFARIEFLFRNKMSRKELEQEALA